MHGVHIYSYKYLNIRSNSCNCCRLDQSSKGWREHVYSIPSTGCALHIRAISFPNQLGIHSLHLGKYLYLFTQKEARKTCGIR